jgi:phage/plasmid-associated DNA primase
MKKKKAVEFEPTQNLILATGHLPEISGRRLVVEDSCPGRPIDREYIKALTGGDPIPSSKKITHT